MFLQIIRKIERVIRPMTIGVNVVGFGAIVVLMFTVNADIIGRYVFNSPITGAQELAEQCLVVAIFLSFAILQSEKGHVSMGLLIDRLNYRTQAAVDVLVYTLGFGIYSLMTWRVVERSIHLIRTGDAFAYLPLPVLPFRIVMIAGLSMLCLEILLTLLYSIAHLVEGERV